MTWVKPIAPLIEWGTCISTKLDLLKNTRKAKKSILLQSSGTTQQMASPSLWRKSERSVMLLVLNIHLKSLKINWDSPGAIHFQLRNQKTPETASVFLSDLLVSIRSNHTSSSCSTAKEERAIRKFLAQRLKWNNLQSKLPTISALSKLASNRRPFQSSSQSD